MIRWTMPLIVQQRLPTRPREAVTRILTWEFGGDATDDDTKGLVLSQSSRALEEGSSATYTVVLSSQPTGAVVVNLTSSNTTAVASPAS